MKLAPQPGRPKLPARPCRQLAPSSPQRLSTAEPPEPLTVEAAVEAYLDSSRARGNSKANLCEKAGVFSRRTRVNPRDRCGAKIPVEASSLLSFCDRKGIRFLSEVTLAIVEQRRATRNAGDLVRSKRQKEVPGFLWFCERHDWFPRNYAPG